MLEKEADCLHFFSSYAMKKYNLPFNRNIKHPFSPVYYIDLYTPYKNIMSLIGTDSMTA